MRHSLPVPGRRAIVASAFMAGLAACTPKPLVAQPPSVETGDDQQATCKVAKDPLNPLIVEWPGTSKVGLDSASQHGVVVVSYIGCVLKVLTSCQAGGAYDFKPVTPVRDKVSIENESDLYARLPLGVASLKSELAAAQRLDLEYVAIGQREAAKPPVSMSGDCAGATHFVRTIMIGAYGLNAVGMAKVSASGSVGDQGVGGTYSESVRRIRGSGDVSKCSEGAAKGHDCAAILQLGLAPLSVAGGGAVTSGGFGAGLGAVTVVPTVKDVTLASGGAASLAAAAVKLLRLLQDAKRADKAAVSFEQKAAAWDTLASYAGPNAYKEMADKRREDWTLAAEAEVRRREQVAKVCAQHKTDSAKLAELVSLDEDVVPAKQKEAYRREMAQVYGPYKDALAECAAVAVARPSSVPRPAPVPSPPSTRDAATRARSLPVPAGSYRMGSNGSESDEKPLHRVTVDRFFMDLTEVTTDAYAACVSAGQCSAADTGTNCNTGKAGRGNHPINCVDWNQSAAYCNWVGKRLPTEEEWEYAARGTEGRTYPWGEDAPAGQLCWGGNGTRTSTCPVGSYPAGASPFGLLDMAGNVWEWTASGHSDSYSQSRQDTTASSTLRVDRGGGWTNSVANQVRTAFRTKGSPTGRFDFLGFRCVK